MRVHTLSTYLSKLEAVSSRIEITKILSELFRETSKKEIKIVVNLILGRLAPNYENLVFNLADKMVLRTVCEAYEVSPEQVAAEYKKFGDLGVVAQRHANNDDSALEVVDLYDRLVSIANDEGEGSQERKISALASVLAALDPLSAKYVTRVPVGKLRLGFSEKTIIDALSWMETGDKTNAKAIELAYQVLPDIGEISQLVKIHGSEKLTSHTSPKFGIPVMPMLAQRIKSPTEMIKKMGEVAVEPKFDGLRALIHYKRGVQPLVFTRNLNEISAMFPELEHLSDELGVETAILDSEAVGLDPENLKMADFQTTMQRRRKHDVSTTSKKIPLRFQVFDVMMVDGKNMMDKTYLERREVLEGIVKSKKLLFVDKFIVTDDPIVIESEHKRLLVEGLEGVLVKKVSSEYVPGRTGWRWVKMKEVEEASGKLADTIDAIIMGYTRGKGKRADFGVGQFLAGIRDGDTYKTITKVGTGMTDEQFRDLSKRLKSLVSSDKPKGYEVHKTLTPDYWVEPKIVVELAADEITKSPNHTAGLALRFPRLVRFREDKSTDEVTTLTEIKNLYKMS